MNKILFSILILISLGCSVRIKTKEIHPYIGDSVGCGSFIIYKLSADDTEYLSVIIDATFIEWENKQTYSIAKANVVYVSRKKYEKSIAASLCNDVMVEKPKLLLTEDATEGISELIISDENIEKAKKNQAYQVSVVLKNISFETLFLDYLYLEKITVGWLPG